MDNQMQIESNVTNGTNGTKYLHKQTDELNQFNQLNQLTNQPIYSTRKSSRRLNQLNSIDHNFNVDNSTNLNNINELNDKLNDVVKSNTQQQTNTAANQISTNTQQNNNQQPTTKQQRKWEQWQYDDSRWFFEALNEHGKDFNAIHSYMTTRLKKKGVPEELIKNKEQIRCYFNRQLNKICSIFEECSDEINNLDKTTKQLYALINYGEMWRKNNFKNDLKIDAKFKAHLNELVFKGYTFLKIGKKGKNVKLKTPVCKALKKIYYFENIYKSINQNLPKDIIIELLPATNYAWMKVHALAQNPRVRVKCSLQKRLSSLIKYLEDRWNDQKYNNLQIDLLTSDNQIKSPKNQLEKSDEIKLDEQVSSSSGFGANDHSINSQKTRRVFKVKPHQAHHRNLTGLKFTRIQPIPFNSQMDISLSAYLLKANSKQKTEQKVKRKNLNVNCAKKMKDDEQKQNNQENGSISKETQFVNHSEKSNTTHVLETVRELNFLKNIVSSNYNQDNLDGLSSNDKNENENSINNGMNNGLNNSLNNNQLVEEKSLHLPAPPPNATIAEWLSANADNNKTELNKSDSNSNTLSPNKDHSASKEDEQKESNKHKESHDQEENIYNKMKKIVDPLSVKNGWSVDEIEDLTIGELYLMLKKPNKIVLQYDWNIVKVQNTNQNNHLDQQNINHHPNENGTKDTSKTQSNFIAQHHQNHNTNCSSLVSKLITAFTLELMSLSKEKNFTAADVENECKQNANDKNQRKAKKLKTNHSSTEDQVEPTDNHTDAISSSSQQQPASTSNDQESTAITSMTTPVTTTTACNNSKNSQSSTSNNDKFVIPSTPAPKPANKRIVNEKLLQEAKEQLCNIKFNNSRRNFRNGALIKQQQQQQQQMQISNICQLLANKGTLTTVPVNVSSASANGQTALISVIAQVNQNNSSVVVPNTMQTTINLDGTQSIQTVQINNATTLNDLCNYVAKCPPSNEPTTIIQQAQVTADNNSLNGNNSLNNNLNSINKEIVTATATDLIHTNNDLIQNSTTKNHHYQEYTTKNTVQPSLDFNTSILTDDKTNDKLNHFSDDKSVSFSNLLDISLSDPIFNDSIFPSDVSIDSTFSTKDIVDQTLNTPIKLTNQKSILNHNNSFSPQFNLFDSNSNAANRNESMTFNDNWMAGNDISLGNIFDNSSFKEDFNTVLNNDRLNSQTTRTGTSTDLGATHKFQ